MTLNVSNQNGTLIADRFMAPQSISRGFVLNTSVFDSNLSFMDNVLQVYKFISQISDLHKVNNKRIYKYNKHIRGYGDDKIETITNIRKQ